MARLDRLWPETGDDDITVVDVLEAEERDGASTPPHAVVRTWLLWGPKAG